MATRLSRRFYDANERSLVSPLELRKPGGRLLYWLAFALLLLCTLSTIFPLYWMFSGALKTTPEMFRMPPSLLPADPQWSNYPRAWTRLRYSVYFRNTLLLALGSWFFQLFVSTTAAFSLSKLRPAFGNAILFLFLSTLMVPSAAYLIPQYLTVVNVPLLNIRLIDTTPTSSRLWSRSIGWRIAPRNRSTWSSRRSPSPASRRLFCFCSSNGRSYAALRSRA
jgi:multiple sugar transport system permease protein